MINLEVAHRNLYFEYIGWIDIDDIYTEEYFPTVSSLKNEVNEKITELLQKGDSNIPYKIYEKQCYEDSVKALVDISNRHYRDKDGILIVYGVCIKGAHIFKELR